MKFTKEQALKCFAQYPEAIRQINKIDGDVYFDLLPATTYKTRKQNNLFHSLLQCFWESGCSSFDNYDSLRNYYKRIAGLVKKQGNTIIESSWADATKDNAKTAIDMCIRDMDISAVIGSEQGKKYEAILRGINEFMGL